MAFCFTPEAPLEAWLAELDTHIARSPNFFAGRPVVLDLAKVKLNPGEIAGLIEELRRRGIRVMGLEGVDAKSLRAEFPPLIHHTRARHVQELTIPAETEPPAPKPVSLIIEQPVRSGQAIAFEGDITVLGSVGSAAELVAGGSIHVYGTLRGRVMAGCAGNPRARIFCQKIDAELIGINGYYRTIEEIDETLRHRPAQAWLDGDDMKITALQ